MNTDNFLATYKMGERNFREADLSKADLSEANLRWADLRWADLRWADLSGANLSEANLSKADLSEANLSEANLRWANLSEANLSRANLRWADLSGARGIVTAQGHDPRGYMLVAVQWSDGPRIKGGCHWFTVDEAITHWSGETYPNKTRGAAWVTAVEFAIKMLEAQNASTFD